jgi:hypothetical protein
LVHDGQKLIPSVTRVFKADEPLLILAQAYPPAASCAQPVVVFVSLYREGTKVLETTPFTFSEGWIQRRVHCQSVCVSTLNEIEAGSYDWQLTVLDPAAGRAAFWRAPIVVTR